MAIQRVGPRPSSLVQQAAAGFTFDGTQPTTNVPAFDANGKLVFPTQGANGGGLFEFEQNRPVAVVRVHIEVPSADVAGWNLYVTDGTLDVEVASSTVVAASYAVARIPIVLMRGESLKLVMVGASAGLIRATVVGATVEGSGDLPNPAATPEGLGLVIGVDVQAWSALLDLVDQDLSTTGDVVFNSLRVIGDVVFEGGSVLVTAEQIDLGANYLIENTGYTTAPAAPQTGGLVVNYLPTATADTTAASGVVTPGVLGVSDPTITTDGPATFAANALVMISGSDNDGENDGLFEVVSHGAAPNLLTLRSTGHGVTSRVEDFTQDQLVANAGDVGMTITQVTLSVLRCGTDGIWEAASGAVTPLVYNDIAGAATHAQLDTVAGAVPLGRCLFAANLLPGNDIDFLVRVEAGFKLSAVKVTTVGAVGFTSALGTFLLTGLRGIAGGGASVLNAAFDLETPSLPAQTDTDVALSAVPGALDFAAADYILFNVASSNADLTPFAATDGVLLTVYVEPI